ncbi:hypothetical protein tb265_09830 [Gemmatimonadetes bacterium T265]|nr:hypothetical protein tb265_09830 [Gemmatimonadetes bacterium T265]
MSDTPLLPGVRELALSRSDLGPAPRAPDSDGVAEARVRTTAARALDAIAHAGLQPAIERAHAAVDARDVLRTELDATRVALCDAVRALAARLRADGAPPERMLVLVKDAVRGGAPAGTDPAVVRELMGDAVRCGIGAYYAAA